MKMNYYTAMKASYCYMKQIWTKLTNTILNKQNQI